MIRQSPPRYRQVPLLTPAEDRILFAILAGHTKYEAIAQELNLEQKRVRGFLVNIYHKTNCPNMAALVLWAWRNGYELSEEKG